MRPSLQCSLSPPAPTASAPAGGGVLEFTGGVLSGAYGLTTGLLWSAVGAVQTVSSVTREAVWETGYMFGINGTPVSRPGIEDSITDIAAGPRGPRDTGRRDTGRRDTGKRDTGKRRPGPATARGGAAGDTRRGAATRG